MKRSRAGVAFYLKERTEKLKEARIQHKVRDLVKIARCLLRPS